MFLFSEELAHILERLEFKSVAARVKEKHGGLLAYLAFKPNVRFDHKLGTKRLQTFGQRFPLLPTQNDAEVRNRDIVSVDRVAVNALL